jgi:Uma2 family endonuclease
MQPPTTLAPDEPAVPPDHTQLPCEDGLTADPFPPPPGPDHKQLPDEDGTFVHNFQEHPQSTLLTGCLLPRLHELRPDGQFCIGCDSGIFWRTTQPPLEGCKAPDWFLVLGVPPLLDGEFRRSYVLWREGVRPLLVIEYVSGDGNEEHDATPFTGKFWVYEQGIAAPFYVIFDAARASVEVYRLGGGRYHRLPANPAGRFPVDSLGVELGLWEGEYQQMPTRWLRAWDAATGRLLPTEEERAEAAEERAEAAEERAAKLAEKLRALGVDPEA